MSDEVPSNEPPAFKPLRSPKLDIDKVLKNFPLTGKPRDIQVQALKDCIKSYNEGKQYVALELPVGGGKSAVAVALARSLGSSYTGTLTEQLQDQYLRDFKQFGMEALKGRGKFTCGSRPSMTCGEAKHEIECEPARCPYQVAKAKAYNSPHIVANYHSFVYNVAMQARSADSGQKLKYPHHRDFTVVDECHAMEPFLLDVASVMVRTNKFSFTLAPLPKDPDSAQPYFDFIKEELLPQLSKYVIISDKRGILDPKTKDELTTLQDSLGNILAHPEDDWVPERGETTDGGLAPDWFGMKPLRVSRKGRLLHGYSDRLLIMSGTILSPYHQVTSVGLDPEAGDFYTYDSPFPAENRPIYVGNLDMGFKARDESWPIMVEQIKALMTSHATQKGVLLCSSNKMLFHIVKELGKTAPALARRILCATGDDRMKKYNEHIASRTPSVLGASGFWEGADLKGNASEFQIIPALPRPMWNGQIKKRAEREAGWYDWLTYVKTLQGFGRSVRTEKDVAVTYVLDKAFRTEFRKKEGLIPLWVKSSVQLID